jgi:RimJ/RimL family protein N-acetyltransferase
MEIKILNFKQKYKDQVIYLISNLLCDLGIISPSDIPIDDEDLQNIPAIYHSRSNFWVAIKGNNVIGTVGIKEINKNTAKLKRMFVNKEFHGSGLGQRLLDKAIKFAKDQKYQKIILNSHPQMKRSHRFYEKNGFKKTEEDIKKVHYEKYLS